MFDQISEAINEEEIDGFNSWLDSLTSDRIVFGGCKKYGNYTRKIYDRLKIARFS